MKRTDMNPEEPVPRNPLGNATVWLTALAVAGAVGAYVAIRKSRLAPRLDQEVDSLFAMCDRAFVQLDHNLAEALGAH
ncbi:MAG: hypothetical protein KIS66_00875 [Fimbriimonadaceae bacterium]|nr:hypothetical protein [Fimbriimonadaceae bacterium]